MIHRAFYTLIGGVPPTLFFPFVGPTFGVGLREDHDPPHFFHAFQHPIPYMYVVKKQKKKETIFCSMIVGGPSLIHVFWYLYVKAWWLYLPSFGVWALDDVNL